MSTKREGSKCNLPKKKSNTYQVSIKISSLLELWWKVRWPINYIKCFVPVTTYFFLRLIYQKLCPFLKSSETSNIFHNLKSDNYSPFSIISTFFNKVKMPLFHDLLYQNNANFASKYFLIFFKTITF